MIEWAAWARPGRGGGSAVVAVTGEAWAAELPKLCPDARVLAVAAAALCRVCHVRGRSFLARGLGMGGALMALLPPCPASWVRVCYN